MDSYRNVLNEEWMNLSSMFSCDQGSDHLMGHELLSNEYEHGLNPSILWPSCSNESNSSNSNIVYDQISLAYPSDHDLQSNFHDYFSQESSNSTDSPPYPSHDIFQFSAPSDTLPDNVSNQSYDVCVMEGDYTNFLLAQVFSDEAMEDMLCLKQDEDVEKGKKENSTGQHVPNVGDVGKETFCKRKYEMLELPMLLEEGNTGRMDKNPKKKTRVSRDNKSTKNSPPKKNQKITITIINRNEDDGGKKHHQINRKGRGDVQSSSCCSSEDDSNAPHDFKGGANNSIEKPRASRGAATDPQSIYARKRRERINEKLKTLQTIVPNGTKVDISTMLEEAVHYVKFLQLQIKLLSSDDKWMYAPIAYNGMDMGLYQNISQSI